MDFYRLFAYSTAALILALLLLISTQSLLVYLYPDQWLGWLFWVMLILIYASITYALAKRFARKPMRPPLLPLLIAPVIMLPPIIFQLLITQSVADSTSFAMYLLGIGIGSLSGSWFGMRAGWNNILQQTEREPS